MGQLVGFNPQAVILAWSLPMDAGLWGAGGKPLTGQKQRRR